jgi:hypothetical protein
VPGGTAQVSSARRKVVLPAPLEPLTRPLVVDEVEKVSRRAVACVPVSAEGAAEPPELLPIRVLLATAGGVYVPGGVFHDPSPRRNTDVLAPLPVGTRPLAAPAKDSSRPVA